MASAGGANAAPSQPVDDKDVASLVAPEIDELPLADLAGFVGSGSFDLPSLLSLASCSKSWQRRIFRDAACRPLWKTIDLSQVGPDRGEKLYYYNARDPKTGKYRKTNKPLVQREKITDASLAALLTRVDAGRVTERLILAGCKSITGTGLGPLAYTVTLRELDLFFSFDRFGSKILAEPDVAAIGRVVRTMPPFRACRPSHRQNKTCGLRIVRGPFSWEMTETNRAYSDEMQSKIAQMKSLMDEFSAQLADRMKTERTLCSCCDRHVYERIVHSSEESSEEQKAACSFCRHIGIVRATWDGWMENDYPIAIDHHTEESFSAIAADLTCFECNNLSCGQDECPETRKCTRCDIVKCKSCGEMLICDSCGVSCCGKCGGIDTCEGCGLSCCVECDHPGGFIPCENTGCKTKLCWDCGEGESDSCTRCQKEYCKQCAEVLKECQGCHDTFCPDHLVQCCECQGSFCLTCSHVCKYCCSDYCDSYGCKDEHNHKCGTAKKVKTSSESGIRKYFSSK